MQSASDAKIFRCVEVRNERHEIARGIQAFAGWWAKDLRVEAALAGSEAAHRLRFNWKRLIAQQKQPTPVGQNRALFVIAEKVDQLCDSNHSTSAAAFPPLSAPSPISPCPFLSPDNSMPPSMRPLASANLISQLQLAGRRSYATSRPSLIASRARWASRPTFHQIALRQSIRRQSSEAPNEKTKPKKRFSLLRWTWRLTYISAIGGLGYVGYGIWQMRNPNDQPEPDPSKKTLVILGMFAVFR